MSSRFSRTLPSHPDLGQQKTQAKELLESFQRGDSDALSRVREQLPDKKRVVLADAQFVVAREYGFIDWAALKAHIDARSARSPEDQLSDALHRGNAKAARRLFEQHPRFRGRINDPVFSFNSPALVAFANNLEIVDVLLDFGADPNRRSEWWAGGFHPLYSAKGAAAERLLAAGAIPDACAAAQLDRLDLLASMIAEDPRRVHERGGDGQTPLHFAQSRAAIDLLLGAGADIDARDVDHRSTAAEWMLDKRRGAGRYELARYLVDRGAFADIFMVAALGLTERAAAMLDATPLLMELLTGRGDYGEKHPSSYHIYFWTLGDSLSPVDVAARFEQQATLDLMLARATPRQRLLFACRGGDTEMARAVVREHPDIIATMAPTDHRAITDAAWNGHAKTVALMLELGFDPRTPGQDTGSALHCAAWEGSAECVEVLLRHPAGRSSLETKDHQHHATPLGWCCHGSENGNRTHDHPRVARLLLEAGAVLGPGHGGSEAVNAVLDEWRRGVPAPRRS